MDKDLKKQSAVHDSDIPVTLNKAKVIKTWYALLDREQGYNNAKFGRPPLKFFLTVSPKNPTLFFL